MLPIVFALWAVLPPDGERRRWLLGTAADGRRRRTAAARGVLATVRPDRVTSQPGPDALSTLWENIGSWLGPDLHYLRLTCARLLPPAGAAVARRAR